MKRPLLCSLILCLCSVAAAQTIYLQPGTVNSTATVPYVTARMNAAGDAAVAITADRGVHVLDPSTLQVRTTIAMGAAKAAAVAIAKDGKSIIVATPEGTINVLDAARGTAIRSFSHETRVRAVDVDLSGRIISGGLDRMVKMWDQTTAQFVGKSPAVPAEIISLAFSPDGRMIVAGAADGSLTIMSSAGFTIYKTITEKRSPAHTILFSADGKFIAVLHSDSTISLWNGRSGEPMGSLRIPGGIASSAAFHPERPVLAVASSILTFWDVTTQRLFSTVTDERFIPQVLLSSPKDQLTLLGRSGEMRSFRMLEKKPDTTPPVITIVNPAVSGSEPVKMFASETDVYGVVSDENAITGVTVNGTPATTAPATADERNGIAEGMQAVSFTATVPLATAGNNTITIAATDAEKNTGTADITIAKLSKDAAVELVSPTESIETDQISLDLQFKVWFDFSSYSVLLNTIEISKKENFPKRPSGTLRTEKLSLSAGLNQIQLSVNGRNGERIRKTLNITRRMLGAPTSTADAAPLRNTSGQPQRWAVIVGVSEYGNPAIKNLAYADRDAKAFAEFLKSSAGGGFEEQRVKVLLNKEATLTNVKTALFNFLRQTVDKDLVVIYFAGHGAPEPANPNNNYLLCYDTDPRSLETTAFPMWDVNTALQRYIPSKRVVVFTDACHSGGISSDIATRGMSATDNNLINQYLTDLSKTKEGIIVFTASQAGEVSQELEKFGHGVFTYYLLEGMKGQADFNNDYTVTIGELMDYVEEKVKRQTSGNQHPTRNQGSYDKDLTISLIPN